MKEKFRDWNPKGTLKITYKDEAREKRLFEYDAAQLSAEILELTHYYMTNKIRLTNRQLYYRLVGKAIIPNAIEIYKKICRFLTDMRYAGILDWEAIEDRGRVPEKPAEWKNLRSLVDSAVYAYRLPRWKGQKYHVELYCEKEAMESILKPIADDYHIYFGYNKGYSSAAAIYELSKRISKIIKYSEKKVIILYLGDHDPSGLDMIRDINDRLYEFIIKSPLYINLKPNFKVIQIALNMEQIKLYNPPPNPAKITDPRAKNYIREFGDTSWELDSLEPEVLRELTANTILNYLDIDKYNEFVEREKREIIALKDFGDSLSE